MSTRLRRCTCHCHCHCYCYYSLESLEVLEVPHVVVVVVPLLAPHAGAVQRLRHLARHLRETCGQPSQVRNKDTHTGRERERERENTSTSKVLKTDRRQAGRQAGKQAHMQESSVCCTFVSEHCTALPSCLAYLPAGELHPALHELLGAVAAFGFPPFAHRGVYAAAARQIN